MLCFKSLCRLQGACLSPGGAAFISQARYSVAASLLGDQLLPPIGQDENRGLISDIAFTVHHANLSANAGPEKWSPRKWERPIGLQRPYGRMILLIKGTLRRCWNLQRAEMGCRCSISGSANCSGLGGPAPADTPALRCNKKCDKELAIVPDGGSKFPSHPQM